MALSITTGHVYLAGALLVALPFLARQAENERLPLVEEFVAHAFGPNRPAQAEIPRKQQLDAILLRMFEVQGVELGTCDSYARRVAFFALECVLKQAQHFKDPWVWNRVAEILASMRLYHPAEMGAFSSRRAPGIAGRLPPAHGPGLSAGNSRVVAQLCALRT